MNDASYHDIPLLIGEFFSNTTAFPSVKLNRMCLENVLR